MTMMSNLLLICLAAMASICDGRGQLSPFFKTKKMNKFLSHVQFARDFFAQGMDSMPAMITECDSHDLDDRACTINTWNYKTHCDYNNTCVQCNIEADCEATFDNDPKKALCDSTDAVADGKAKHADGQCVECMNNGDCNDGKYCSLTTRTCINCAAGKDNCDGLVCPAAACEACTSNSDCATEFPFATYPLNQACDDGTGSNPIAANKDKCVECVEDTDCPLALTCDANQECSACATDSECGDDKVCNVKPGDANFGKCVACSDTNCAANGNGNDYCNAASNACVECRDDEGHCAATFQICTADECADCSTDAECTDEGVDLATPWAQCDVTDPANPVCAA